MEEAAKIKDAYGRKILEPTFENVLSMSKNSLKLNYSKLKNAALVYKFIKTKFDGGAEIYFKAGEPMIRLEIEFAADRLLLYLNLKSADLDKKIYSHRTVKEDKDGLSVLYTVGIGKSSTVKRALELVGLVMETHKAERSKAPVRVAYAERYPYKENFVLKGCEDIPPVSELDEKEYGDVYGELSKAFSEPAVNKGGRPKKNMSGEEKLNKIRQTAKTVKGAMAISEPIVYYYSAAVNRDDQIAYVSVQQTLNDRFFGKIVEPQFFAVAEGSDRVEKFNFLALDQLKKDCDLRKDLKFSLNVSCRLLIKQPTFDLLKKRAAEIEGKNLIMSFDCLLLEALGDLGLKRITELRQAGALIMIDNTEQAGMKVLTEYPIDYIRLDSRYYAAQTPKAVAHLQMLTGYAKTQGIISSALYVDTIKQALLFLSKGADVIQGSVVSEPKRLIHVALKERKKLPTVV
jgi:FOG: EAL domain